MAAKVDSLKDEMDEALNKVEQCKVLFLILPQSFKFTSHCTIYNGASIILYHLRGGGHVGRMCRI